MFPDLSNNFGDYNVIFTDGKDGQNYENQTQAVLKAALILLWWYAQGDWFSKEVFGMIIVKFKDTTGTNYHTSKSTSKNGASTRIKANTDNEGHMHSGTHTHRMGLWTGPATPLRLWSHLYF